MYFYIIMSDATLSTNNYKKTAMTGSKTFPLGRDSKTGEFIPVKEAQRRPNTTTVERIPKSGRGDTKK